MSISTESLITNAVGSIGRYQIAITLLIFLCRFPDVWHQLLVLMIAPPVGNFTCVNTSLTECDKNCPKHNFDHSVWENTIIHEWDLVCDQEYILSIIQSMMMFGVLIGSILFGFLADRFGRRGTLILCVMIHLVAGIIAAFAPWLWLHTFLRFLCNVGVGGTIVTGFSIITEFIDLKHRPLFLTMQGLPSIVAGILLALIGYLSRRWDHIQLIVSVPTVTLLSYWCLLPESPRWLLTMGEGERVIKILETGAKCNKLPTEHIRPQVEEYLSQDINQHHKKGGNIVDLFRTRRMRIKTIVLCINWLIVSMIFFCIMLYIGQITGNIFINIAAACTLQMIGNIFLCFVIDKISRKTCIITFYIICAIPLLIIIALPENFSWAIQIMACISCMGIATSFRTLFVYSGELYPTIIRTIGMGVSSVSARIGSMISPFLIEMKRFGSWIPPLVFSIFTVIGAVLLLILPETRDVPLPDTVEEADQI